MASEKKPYETPRIYSRDIAPPRTMITKEYLLQFRGIGLEVKADFSTVLEALRSRTGTNLTARPEGQHITIVGPQEKGALKTLTEENVKELQEISEEIAQSQGIQVEGIGFIDGGNSNFEMRDADRSKRVAFVALDIPRLQKFREKIGLPPKDFHLTLGFEGGDIHSQVIGQEEYKPGKFKEARGPIPKSPDPRFDDLITLLPELKFTGISGQSAE